jgi:hypothetical protein
MSAESSLDLLERKYAEFDAYKELVRRTGLPQPK